MKESKGKHSKILHYLDHSSIWVIVGVILLFSTAIGVILIAPRHIDSTWTSPTSPYQVQMYEISDPHFYMSSASTGGNELQYVHHLKKGLSLLAFKENENLRLVAAPELEQYITKHKDKELKLTSQLLLLREPEGEMKKVGEKLQDDVKVKKQVLELYNPGKDEAFSFDPTGGILQNWVDENFKIIDEMPTQYYQQNYGVIYVQNPQEFRIQHVKHNNEERWRYDPGGEPVKDLNELKGPLLKFHSRKDLIEQGEQIYAIEGCWYCHTDQTRTLIEDVVLNGSDSFPAPPSSANEFIYQKITFPGTRRIGPDISRVGVKRPSRDWHKAHFWAPKTASAGSIMPAFQHFFDNDPRGTSKSTAGIPNYQFEAIYQYMMTKGTRITAPTQAWWLGKDPINTKEIIEGQRKLR